MVQSSRAKSALRLAVPVMTVAAFVASPMSDATVTGDDGGVATPLSFTVTGAVEPGPVRLDPESPYTFATPCIGGSAASCDFAYVPVTVPTPTPAAVPESVDEPFVPVLMVAGLVAFIVERRRRLAPRAA